MPRNDESPRRRFGPGALVASLAGGLALWCAYDTAQLASLRNAYATQVHQVNAMQGDAQALLKLRARPRLATDRRKPNDELLAQVREALKSVTIPADRWVGNEPTPIVRVPRSPYDRLSVRLRFERITRRQLADFAYTLATRDPTLTISAVQMTRPRHEDGDGWDVVVTISYLIYTPSE